MVLLRFWEFYLAFLVGEWADFCVELAGLQWRGYLRIVLTLKLKISSVESAIFVHSLGLYTDRARQIVFLVRNLNTLQAPRWQFATLIWTSICTVKYMRTSVGLWLQRNVTSHPPSTASGELQLRMGGLFFVQSRTEHHPAERTYHSSGHTETRDDASIIIRTGICPEQIFSIWPNATNVPLSRKMRGKYCGKTTVYKLKGYTSMQRMTW